ncbi:MAG: translation initiation factor IF-2 [Bacteroidales bacterium]|jgi:translation initiation factor IF-2|nr:translation initiation factor IF-2 [Bacteroidales bacterium]
MSEEIKIPRLGKAAIEFNIATSTIVEFLSKKGFTIEDSINTKLTADMYNLLTKEYQSEKNIKEVAQRLDIGTTVSKRTSTGFKTGKGSIKKELKKELAKATDNNLKKTTISQKAVAEEKKTTEKITTVEKASITETPVEMPVETPVETETERKIHKFKILGTVDLDTINDRAKTGKKTKDKTGKTEPAEETKEKKNVKEKKKAGAIKTEEVKSVDAKEQTEVQEVKQLEKVEQQPEEQLEKQKVIPVSEEKTQQEDNLQQETAMTEKIVKEKEPEPSEQSEPKEEIKSEKDIEEATVVEEKEAPELFKPGTPKLSMPTVVGKVDLEALKNKNKSPNKTYAELKRENEERMWAERAALRAKRKERHHSNKKKDQTTTHEQKDQTTSHEKAKRQEYTSDKKDKHDNLFKPAVEKLSGVKVVDKIDLSSSRRENDKKPEQGRHDQRRQDQGKSEHGKHDQRRQDQGKPDHGRPDQRRQDQGRPEHKKYDQRKPDQGRPDPKKQDQPKTDKDGKREQRPRFIKFKDTDAKPGRTYQKDLYKRSTLRGEKKAEITNEEVDSQIRRTMARMAPSGKTKSSKYRREKREQIHQEIEQAQERQAQERSILKVTEFVTVNDLANMLNIPVNQLIGTCMNIGLVVAINQRLDAETIVLLAEDNNYSVQFVGVDEEEEKQEDHSNPEDWIHRAPIVTVMGHVDHGKTSLLDYIRKTNIIAGEAGGITQHIGAYEVDLGEGRKITFLDTPGHEAFTAMRARGAKVTDIVIVVIAADDSIMPQTVEAINHAQAAGVPMIFAINKIDKPGADPEKIRAALANMNLLVEEWGGKIQSQDISAKKGINVDILLEKILIEAEMLELQANPKATATGTVIESSLDKGRGYIAKMLIQNGTLHKGEVIAAGTSYGKIRAMYNQWNQLITSAGPSSPILLLGLDSAPQAGDTFKVYSDEREAKSLVGKRQQLIREQGLRTQKHITLTEIGRRITVGDFKELNIIVKGDVDGSIEALSDALLRLTTEGVEVKVIHKSVGQVTESDVLLASASNAIIIAFQVRPSAGARKLAEQEQIDIRTYSIIYDVINEIKDAIEGMRAPEMKEIIVCNIEVRQIFRVSKVGVVAGCYILDGKIQRNTRIRVIRDGIVIFTGKLGSLKRFKEDVRELSAGYECGLNIESFNDVQVGDIIEGFEEIEVKRQASKN